MKIKKIVSGIACMVTLAACNLDYHEYANYGKDYIDESYENVSSRMMGNQKLVEKFVRKFLDDPTYEQIKEAVNKMDYDEILRTTHTMKGIASNLEFTHLQQKSAKAVDMIRAGQREEVLPVIGEIEKAVSYTHLTLPTNSRV